MKKVQQKNAEEIYEELLKRGLIPIETKKTWRKISYALGFSQAFQRKAQLQAPLPKKRFTAGDCRSYVSRFLENNKIYL